MIMRRSVLISLGDGPRSERCERSATRAAASADKIALPLTLPAAWFFRLTGLDWPGCPSWMPRFATMAKLPTVRRLAFGRLTAANSTPVFSRPSRFSQPGRCSCRRGRGGRGWVPRFQGAQRPRANLCKSEGVRDSSHCRYLQPPLSRFSELRLRMGGLRNLETLRPQVSPGWAICGPI
jgi:hypothetical protein